ncbi:MAG: hypothetical protein ACE14M_08505 [Terriglobales bacterium]
MITRKKRKSEGGAALLLAVFSLLLLSSIGLAMLFSSDTETVIALNYRDKQSAIYGALAGLQEARDRIHPCNGDLGVGTNGDCTSGGANVLPTALPSLAGTSGAYVLYIINPKDGETIAPWDPSNPYFDTELCHETYAQNVLGVAAPADSKGPCPKDSAHIPAGSTWYAAWDNSSHSWTWNGTETASTVGVGWSLSSPLTYKWVRITLKSDNMTPIPVFPLGGSANGTQVCWDGKNQKQKPATYGNNCQPPMNAVTKIDILSSGTGYADGSHPTVTIAPPPCTINGTTCRTATATADVHALPSGITSTTLTDPGSGYTIAHPVVTITRAAGDTQTQDGSIEANVNGAPVQSVTLTNGTSPACYPAGSSISASFDTSVGSGGVASVTMSGNRCIYSFTGNGRCGDGTVNVSGPGGFTGKMTFGGPHNEWISSTVTNPGNYDTMPAASQLTFTCSNPGSGSNTPRVTSITPGIQISSVSVSAGGNYMAAPNVTFGGATPIAGSTTGVGNLGAAGGTAGQVGSLQIINAGLYDYAPTLTIAPPVSGTNATATASVNPEHGVTQITITDGGAGYPVGSSPTVTIAPPSSGTTAQGKATIGAGGGTWGPVYLVTAMAQTQSGARAMAQMEVGVTYNQFTMNLGGAVTMAGPAPPSPDASNFFGTPNSNPFHIDGHDQNSCGETVTNRPAIGAYDDPNNPTDPTAVDAILDALGRPQNYTGAGGETGSDVVNSYSSLGGITPQGLCAFVESVKTIATNIYPSNPSSIALGSSTSPIYDVVEGDLALGPNHGYGMLVVTGNLTISGNYNWDGLIIVLGGATVNNGGGNGQINGALFVANTNGGCPASTSATLGSPFIDWSGGGGNGIYYDHCKADNLINNVPFTATVSPHGLQVISVKTLVY